MQTQDFWHKLNSLNYRENIKEHAIFLMNSAKNLETTFQSRLYSYLSDETANFSKKLVYAIPANIILKLLSPMQIICVGFISGSYLWSCEKEIITHKTKVELLHAIAIAIFANLIQMGSCSWNTSLLQFPLEAALLGATLIFLNQLDKKNSVEFFA